MRAKIAFLFLALTTISLAQVQNSTAQSIENDLFRYANAKQDYANNQSDLGKAYFDYFWGRQEQAQQDLDFISGNPTEVELSDYFIFEKQVNSMRALVCYRYYINSGDINYFILYVYYTGRTDQIVSDRAVSNGG